MKVLLSGYYGFDNAGDDAVLFAIVQAMKERNIEDITVLSAKPEETAKQYGVKAVNRWGKVDLIKAIFQCDVLISGGGSLLQDVTSKNGILYYLGIIRLAQMLHKKVFIYAQGIGPILNERNRSLTKRILNKTNGITVRDFDSYQELQKMGVYREIIVSSDPVLGISEEIIDASIGECILSKQSDYDKDKQTIMVSIRSWEKEAQLFREIGKACDMLMDSGWQIVFVPFHYPSDKDAALKIATGMNHKPILLQDNYSPLETMAILKCANMVIGMRLHSLIMGYALKKPVIGLSYDPKVASFMQMTRQKYCFDVNTLQVEDLIKAVQYHMDNQEKEVAIWNQMYPVMAKQAKEPVEMLLKL